MQLEVITEGVLELGMKPASTARKDWKRRLFVLKWYPIADRATLDYYKDRKKRWQTQEAAGVVSLWPAFEVSLAHSCPYKFTIQLLTGETQLYIACNTEEIMYMWLNLIQIQRKLDAPRADLYVYLVTVHDNKYSRQMGLKEDCFLALTPREILCAYQHSRQVVGVWPIKMLRRYWSENKTFGFEAGRHSPRGEGTYLFSTNQDAEIYDMLKRLTSTTQEGSTGTPNTRPPAPLPPKASLQEETRSNLMDGSKEEDDKKYDIVVAQPAPSPVLPPKPFLKSKSETSTFSRALPPCLDASLEISPAYASAAPTLPAVKSTSTLVTNVLYGSASDPLLLPASNPLLPPASNPLLPLASNPLLPSASILSPSGTLRQRYLHESIAPSVVVPGPQGNASSLPPSVVVPGPQGNASSLPPQQLHPLHTDVTSSSSVSKWIQGMQQAQVPPGTQTQHEGLGSGPPCEGNYTHTVHKMPLEFVLAEGPSVSLGPTLYNTLVHKGVQPHPPRGEEAPPSPTTRDQQGLYDIAFTQTGSNSRPTSRNDYSIAYVLPPDQVDGHVYSTQNGAAEGSACVPTGPKAIREAVPRRSPSPAAPPPPSRGAQEEGLTANPLYGSQDTIIKQVMSLKISTPELQKKLSVLPGNEQQAGQRVGEIPLLGEVPLSGGVPSLQSPNCGTGTTSGNGLLGVCPTAGTVMEGNAPPTRDTGEGTIQRDSKGYSKVSKESQLASQSEGNLPPPLPERHYD